MLKLTFTALTFFLVLPCIAQDLNATTPEKQPKNELVIPLPDVKFSSNKMKVYLGDDPWVFVLKGKSQEVHKQLYESDAGSALTLDLKRETSKGSKVQFTWSSKF